jgi:uncharacterized protein (UPF0248 family)
LEIYKLPQSTLVNRNVPKNAFDQYANSKQKKDFTNYVAKITWKHKISKETVNLSGDDVKEIQLFEIILKEKQPINSLLDLIDKSIPYHIIFIVNFEEEVLIRTSKKHSHPINPDNSVIDWVFVSDWIQKEKCTSSLKLKGSIDSTYQDFCSLISGNKKIFASITEMIEYQSKIKELTTFIDKLESQIKKSKQFNKQIEMNMELNNYKDQLHKLIS